MAIFCLPLHFQSNRSSAGAVFFGSLRGPRSLTARPPRVPSEPSPTATSDVGRNWLRRRTYAPGTPANDRRTSRWRCRPASPSSVVGRRSVRSHLCSHRSGVVAHHVRGAGPGRGRRANRGLHAAQRFGRGRGRGRAPRHRRGLGNRRRASHRGRWPTAPNRSRPSTRSSVPAVGR